MNAVGIDVSKGKSMVCVMRSLGEIVINPFEVIHNQDELGDLADRLKQLDGETKIIMECTGSYHLPVANYLHEEGLTICAIHAKLIYDFGNNSIRKVKTDRADSVKIANYGLTHWLELPVYTPEDDTRHMLKAYSRQYNKYAKIKTMLKNNLISLLDQTFPDVNIFFDSPARESDGHQKWIDFAAKFWHCECVCTLSFKAFADRYRRWCKRHKYYYKESQAEEIHMDSAGHFGVMPKNDVTKLLVTQSIAQVNAVSENLAVIKREMIRLAKTLPEFDVAVDFYGVSDQLASQIIAEVGNVYRFNSKKSLVAFAGLDAPPCQSGKFESTNRNISKKGSSHLRKALWQVMDCLIQKSPADNPIYQFLDKKRSEGKHYYSYMCAGSAKFLRIYYARAKEVMDEIHS